MRLGSVVTPLAVPALPPLPTAPAVVMPLADPAGWVGSRSE